MCIRDRSIDCVSTFIEAAGGEVPNHIVEGRSLLPFLYGNPPDDWREFAVSEYDFAVTPMRTKLGLSQRESRLFMIADKRWKFMHCESGCKPMLFDMHNDPDELNDLGKTNEHAEVIDLMYQRLGQWGRRMSQRVTRSDTEIENMAGRSRRRGILLGVYDGSELDEELLVKYRGSTSENYLD